MYSVMIKALPLNFEFFFILLVNHGSNKIQSNMYVI